MKKSKFTLKVFLLAVGLLIAASAVYVGFSDKQALAAGCAKPASGTPTSLVPFNVPAKGTYVMWVRMKVPNATNDSINAQVGATYCFVVGGKSVTPNTWTWVNYQNNVTNVPNKVNFTLTGKHTVYLIGNKPGVSVDRVIFTSDTSCKPTGTAGTNCQSSSDTTPPTVSLTAPAASATVSGNATLSATASDTSGITSVNFLVDGKSVNVDTASPYSFSWNSTSVANGTHTVVAQATDKAGNVASSKSVSVTVKNTSTGGGGGGGTTTTGWPNASNTGVPAGQTLTSSGSITVSTAGTVISNKDVNGSITINANNVTIKNTRVHGKITDGYNGHTGIVIQDTEVIGPGTDDGQNRVPLVGAEGYTCIRCNLHSGNSGFEVAGNVTIQDSYVHDIAPSSNVHKTAVGANSGAHVVVRHNSLDCGVGGCSAALSIYGDFGQPDDWTVDNNLFNTEGSYCVYAGSVSGKKFPIATNIRFTNNHFGKKYHSTCGIYGAATSFESGHGNVWSGNVWDDGSGTVNP